MVAKKHNAGESEPMGVVSSCSYEGNLRCTLTHGPSNSSFATDAPTDNAGLGESFSPTDLLAAGLVSCAITTLAIKAAKENLSVGTCRGQAEKIMTTQGMRQISELRVSLEFMEAVNPVTRAKFETWAKECPVALSLSPSINISFSFEYPR